MENTEKEKSFFESKESMFEKTLDSKSGFEILKYKEENVYKNNIPEGMTVDQIKNVHKYDKEIKTDAVRSAGQMFTSYFKDSDNKDKKGVIAEFQTGLGSKDKVEVLGIPNKKVKVPGTNEEKEVFQIKVKDRTSSSISKSFIKETANKVDESLK